ncbi:MAG: EamA family transporter [Bryobacterales bacterium]|nr:EamA family transporter [Bryobacterales bacterium]
MLPWKMHRHSLFRAYLALGAVCFFWGTTYTAIRMALESLPPLFIVSTRFLLSGSIMLLAAKLAGARLPRGRELWFTSLFGVMVLGVGNTALVMAEQWIPSGVAALFITTSPFWMVSIEAALPGGERLYWPAIGGMLVGFAGTVALALRGMGETTAAGSNYLLGFATLQLGTLGWCLGSVLQRRQRPATHPVVSGAVQQMAAGLAMTFPAIFVREPAPAWTWRSGGALVYLAVFGSIVGYSAFIYSMDKLPVALVSIYNYVNPVVAVILGWMVFGEHFGRKEALAMFTVFLGVGLVKRYSPHRAR